MIKPIAPNRVTFTEIQIQLNNQLRRCISEIARPLSLTTKCACTFKALLIDGTLKYLATLDDKALSEFMDDFRSAQISKMFTDYNEQTRKEREHQLVLEDQS